VFVDRIEGVALAFVGVSEREAIILADALDGEIEAVQDPDAGGTPEEWRYTCVCNMQAFVAQLAETLRLRGELYDRLTDRPKPPTPEPSRWQCFKARILHPLTPLVCKSALATALYVWTLGPVARRRFLEGACAMLALKAEAGGV